MLELARQKLGGPNILLACSTMNEIGSATFKRVGWMKLKDIGCG